MVKVGDTVICDGDSGFCDRTETTIKSIKKRFDEETGSSYDVYVVKDGQEFDGRDGYAITPPMSYYIEELLH